MFKGPRFKPKTPDLELLLAATIKENEQQLYRIAYSYVKNEADALEVISEGIVKSFESLHQLKEPNFMKTWLIRILIHHAISFNKKKRHEVAVSIDQLDVGVHESIDHIDSLDLQASMEQLSDDQKTIIQLRFFEDLPLSDIASILDEPLSTVKSKLYRTLKQLKIALSEEV